MLSSDFKTMQSDQGSLAKSLLTVLRLDYTLLLGLLVLVVLGLLILYSASSQDIDSVIKQLLRLAVGFGVMLLLAQIPPHNLKLWSPWLYAVGILGLVLVFMFGDVGKGAQRWLDLGIVRFQPSEMMKLVVPMMVASYLCNRPLPPTFSNICVASAIVLVPMLLIIKQPDLGTSLLVGCAGFFTVFLAGLSWRFILAGSASLCALAPVLWSNMHAYQQQRVLTFLNPENDPLGSGYHIIQSKIAIGSGGVYGKGWLNGTQSHLDFLPERSTDFIFSVYGEEFGFFGTLLLLFVYFFILFAGLRIAIKARDSYSRLLAGTISLTFFVYLIVNVGMVMGLLPVVGVPLPLVSYGGTSMVTLMAGFGIMMSIRSDRRFLVG